MPEINHRIGVKATIQQVYQALSTNEGLAAWWTTDSSGAGEVGSLFKPRFNGHGPDLKISHLKSDSLVEWHCMGGDPEAWQGTDVSFSLQQDEQQTFVIFKHTGWKEASDFMAHCSMKWAVFLLSLKQLLETGKGRPFPDDISIGHN